MFAPGHIALGYFAGKMTQKATQRDLVIPALWTCHCFPTDLLIPFLEHRGPIHSLTIAALAFSPLLITRTREAAPYFASLATHSLIGDYATNGGAVLLWPITTAIQQFRFVFMFGCRYEAYVELLLFLALIMTLIFSKDYKHLFKSGRSNSLLFIPLIAIILPTMFKYPVYIPNVLIAPHLILMALIALSMATSLKARNQTQIITHIS